MHDDCRNQRRQLGARRPASSDTELVAAIGRGDQSALAEVVRREGHRVLAIATTVCGYDRAEDVTQVVFAALWQRPDRFDPARGSLRAFLILQARSRATDAIRSDGSRSRRDLSSSISDATRQRGRSDLVEDEIIGRTEREAVQAALERIPQKEREVITLAYFGGCTYRQVAAALDRPEGTVKSQIRSGLTRLRVLLNDSLAEPAAPHSAQSERRARTGVAQPVGRLA